MTDTITDAPVLSAAQRERAAALRVARDVLVSKGFASSGAARTADLITVAEYVTSGSVPVMTCPTHE